MRRTLRTVAAALTLLAAGTLTGTAAAAPPGPAPGAPGVLSRFDLARKDCVGTAYGTGSSKVWYTVAGGVLSDVYNPTIDTTNVQTMQLVVTDGRTFTDLQSRDLTYTVSADRTGMTCTVTATSQAHGYRLLTTYVTDPVRQAVLVRARLAGLGEQQRGDRTGDTGPPRGLSLYVRLDPTVGGNGGGGPVNGGADNAVVVDGPGGPVPVAYDTNTVTNAVNRDYAVPTYLALRADRPFGTVSVGYAGTASDGLSMLDGARRLTAYSSALAGNVVTTAELRPRDGEVTLALGFGRSQQEALGTADAAVTQEFDRVRQAYERGWRAYDRTLNPPPARLPGQPERTARDLAGLYYRSANVLKASEDKTFPGAVVASLASPWGQAVSAGDAPGGRPVFFGSYREVFARDLYETFTGLLAAGDTATAQATVRFLFERQQLPDGRFPRNSLVNGKPAPDTGGDQLDETAYPILMAAQAGLGGDGALYRDHVRPAADFLVAHGPAYGVERWEEQGGYSPSTIAAEIAGLVSAGDIADAQGDAARARTYRATADHFARQVKAWTVTTTGPYGPRYFLRLSKTGDPNAPTSYNLGNGGPTADQRAVVDAGFLELTRLGILPAGDPDVTASLPVVDAVISRDTPSGRGFYRYGTASAGTEDGYGDCYEPDPTACAPSGRPWPTGNTGSGHLWPVLSGERAEQALQAGDAAAAARLLADMARFSAGVGLVPEQAWENPELPASPYGTDPTVASIGFRPGQPAGSAAPLTWAQAQLVRLAAGLRAGRLVEQPASTRARYVDHRPPAAAPLRVDAPADRSTVTGSTVVVQGVTAPGARVEVLAANTDSGAPATVVSTVADTAGGYRLTVPVGFGTVVLTVAVTAPDGATGYAQRRVVGDTVAGRTVLDVADPTGDDNGPGTYAYPTAPDFTRGAFDLTRFRVIDAGDTVYLRVSTADLTPTFGNPIGAQLVDVFVRVPGASPTSTAAPYPSRNYAVADGWSQRIEVQGFAAPVYVDAAGRPMGPVSVRSSEVTRTITLAVPAAAMGTPGPGWVFTVVLTGQDGFSPDQARGFTATPGAYTFGVCPSATTPSPICGVDPGRVAKAMDVVTPAGVDQATELDPTRGPVQVRGVPVP
ncbi:MAG: glucodextranase DOMON-like domain-containing protein [Actinomycetota bacterium]